MIVGKNHHDAWLALSMVRSRASHTEFSSGMVRKKSKLWSQNTTKIAVVTITFAETSYCKQLNLTWSILHIPIISRSAHSSTTRCFLFVHRGVPSAWALPPRSSNWICARLLCCYSCLQNTSETHPNQLHKNLQSGGISTFVNIVHWQCDWSDFSFF